MPLVADSKKTSAFSNVSIDQNPSLHSHRKNYNSIFSANLVNTIQNGAVIFAVNHSENKGEINSTIKTLVPNSPAVGDFPNSIAPGGISNSVGTLNNGFCAESNGCYFAFVSSSWLPYNAANNWGQNSFIDGPVITWPSRGYLAPSGPEKKFQMALDTPIPLYLAITFTYFMLILFTVRAAMILVIIQVGDAQEPKLFERRSRIFRRGNGRLISIHHLLSRLYLLQ